MTNVNDSERLRQAKARAVDAERKLALLREKTDRDRLRAVDEKIEHFLAEHGAKFGKTARDIFTGLLRDSMLGVLDAASFATRLKAFAEALPPAVQARVLPFPQRNDITPAPRDAA